MSNSLIKIFFVMLLLTMTNPLELLAQESGFPASSERNSEEEYTPETELPAREGGMMLNDREDVKKSEAPSTESSVKKETVKPLLKKEDEKATPAVPKYKNQDDEAVLSFNFLYYLIQKFKFDAVESR
jgi:hypothetical protein